MRRMWRTGKHLESKGKWQFGKGGACHSRCSRITNTTLSTEHSGAIVLVCCFRFFYAVGGARLGPGARGASPRASTFSATRLVAAKSGGMTQDALNRDVGADARCSARTTRWCETCRRCADADGFASNTTASACATTTARSASLARAPFVRHSAYSPKRTATSESWKEAEFRRAMRVPAGSCTRETFVASRTLAANRLWILKVNLGPYPPAVRPSRDLA
jgi:hypothetical protein